MIKYAFCYSVHIQQNRSAVLERKHFHVVVVVQDIVKMQSDSHSGRILVLFCGAEEEERFAEMLT